MRIKSVLGVALLGFSAAVAQAHCIVGDRSSVNKSVHLVGTAVITIVVADRADSLAWGIGAAAAVGAYREYWKAHQPGMSCESSSIAYDLAGIAAGSAVHHWAVIPQPGGVAVAYRTEF